MHLADIAWDEVSSETIRNCWLKASILPKSLLNPLDLPALSAPIFTLLNQPQSADIDNLIVYAEQEVTDSLAQLESRGVLQPKNKMDLQELLHPEGEQNLVEDISDEEVFEAVLLM
ncbi:hypothetical protein BC827DRAFT_1272037 [Russula dissimulans]|nr:hypothetical protein BC827DRAFT_1272037 [Russula dissimulans]